MLFLREYVKIGVVKVQNPRIRKNQKRKKKLQKSEGLRMANEKFTNVFEEFFKVKSYLERNGDLYGDIPKEFVKKLEQYFNSYVWARDKIDRSLYLRAGQHLSIPDIADATRRKVSTLKGRVQQLSHKICDKLFDGSPLNTDLLSKDNQTLLHFLLPY